MLPMHVPRYNRMQHRVSVGSLESFSRTDTTSQSTGSITRRYPVFVEIFNIQFHWARKLAPLTVVFLVSMPAKVVFMQLCSNTDLDLPNVPK